MSDLFDTDPVSLVRARGLCHQASQWPSRAARANLIVEADDSHSNLGWLNDQCALVSRFLNKGEQCQLGFCFNDQRLLWLESGQVQHRFDLSTSSEALVGLWVDELLDDAGLQPATKVEIPYELDEQDYAEFTDQIRESITLGRWFSLAHSVLDPLVESSVVTPIAKPSVRCWPHHFDIATLFVLQEGDAETAQSIGVGMSPGDGNYPEPYFYCSPWPVPEFGNLPEPVAPSFWHTDGFLSVVAPASQLKGSDMQALLPATLGVVQSVL